jgi:hypothetical protein
MRTNSVVACANGTWFVFAAFYVLGLPKEYAWYEWGSWEALVTKVEVP